MHVVSAPPLTRVVAFDVGETLVGESRQWMRHAERLGIAPMTFLGVFGALVAEGRGHRDVFAFFGVDADRYLASLDARNDPLDGIVAVDLYPDAAPTLAALQAAGHRVAIVGNQPMRAAAEIRALGLAVDVVATSAAWGVAKPDPAFFERVAQECGAVGKFKFNFQICNCSCLCTCS